MFHLFNDVYVQSEIFMASDLDRINISPTTGFEYHKTFADDPELTQLGFAKSLDDFTGEKFLELLRLAANNPTKVFVFVDSATYSRLYAIQLKALFPNISYEHFKFFFVCKKAVIDGRAATSYAPSIDPRAGAKINNAVVDELYHKDDSELIEAMADVLNDEGVNLSLEWNVLKLLTDGEIGTIPDKVKNLVKRVALSVVHETLGSVGFSVTDPRNWEFLGCDADTLLEYDSIFQGCTNLGYMNNPAFLGKSTLGLKMPDQWMIELIKQVREFLVLSGEVKSHLFMGVILELYEGGFKYETAEDCIAAVTSVFANAERTVSLPHSDLGKYDENLIRFLLRSDRKEITALREGSQW
jgi:hypothetical protein